MHLSDLARKPPRRLLIIVVTGFLLIPAVGAEDHDETEQENEVDDAVDGDSEWRHEVQVGAAEASIEMRSESEDTERTVSFDYFRDDAAVEFEYEGETPTAEAEARMEVQFHQLVEYEDSNDNGRYDAGEPIVSAFQLNEDDEETLTEQADPAAWGPIERAAHTSDDGVPGTRLSSTADVGGGNLRFDFYVYGDQATLGAASIEPTEIKLDITITDYPYASNSSALALLLESEAEVEVEDDDDVDSDEDGVVAQAGEARLQFAWKDFATVDGSDMDVKTTKLETSTSQEPGEYEHEALIVLSYPRGDHILHDPTMGVQSSDASDVGAPGPGLALVALGTLVVAAVLRRR